MRRVFTNSGVTEIEFIGLQSMCYELRNPIWRGNTYLNFYLGTVALVTIKILQGFLRH